MTARWLVWLTLFTVLAVVTAVALGAPQLLAEWWRTLTGTLTGIPA
jgi:hypothetical protein